MSTAESTVAAPSRPETLVSFLALYRLLLRTQITVPRLLGIAALGALSLLLGLFARLDDNSAEAAVNVVANYGLGVLVPFATLWLGASAIGDLVDDRLLVYLWLKPVARWQLPAAAVLATVSVVLPLTAVPLVASTLIAGAGDVAPAAFLAASFGTLAYAGLFVAAGLWFRARSLVGARLRPGVGERRRQHGGRRGPLHRQRLGVLRSRPRARRRRVRRSGVRCRRVRRPPRDRGRRLAGRDLALPPRRHRLSVAAQTTRPSSTQPLWPPRPIAFESATSSSDRSASGPGPRSGRSRGRTPDRDCCS